MTIEDDLFDEDGTDLSREFLKYQARGDEPFCSRPWRTLKIHLDAKTKVCCDFFTMLPTFEFPTAREFHRENGMWNHPFMQHMRATMGLPGEVPFCTLCLTADKRDPTHADRRKAAMSESRVLYQRLDEEQGKRHLRGSLGQAPDDLKDVTIPLKSGGAFKPFRASRNSYRRRLADYGFLPRKRVLLFGCKTAAWAPFLAEACETFVAADMNAGLVRRVIDTCRFFDIEATGLHLPPGDAETRFDDGYFDGIWVDGQSIVVLDNPISLAELRRVLAPDGTLHCHMAPGPGRFLQTMANEANPEKREQMQGLLRKGFDKQQIPPFFAQKHLRGMLRANGLSIDVAKAVVSACEAVESIDGLSGLDAGDIALLKERYEDAREKIDMTLSFSALRRPDVSAGSRSEA